MGKESMPRRLITISYTPLDAGGGVPKFNRDLHEAFPDRECLHFCWQDFPWHPEVDARWETEWGRARTLNEYLVRSRKVTSDDVVVADGFWADGLDHLPLAVSHSHGIWSHLTHEDVLAGKQPDMPQHHAVQVEFRRRWASRKKHLTAVSQFIADQMRLQWGFVVDRVINNGVDTDDTSYVLPDGRKTVVSRGYAPLREKIPKMGTVILHGVNDRSNLNKGWNHIEFLQKNFGADSIISFDDLIEGMMEPPNAFPDRHSARMAALGNASLVVHPSGYEGNSLFVLETLACGIPIVAYDVGLLYQTQQEGCGGTVGELLSLRQRSPETTLGGVSRLLERIARKDQSLDPRGYSLNFSLERFKSEWRDYVEHIERSSK